MIQRYPNVVETWVYQLRVNFSKIFMHTNPWNNPEWALEIFGEAGGAYKRYPFLIQHQEFLWENLSINDIIGEWTQAIIIQHPSDISVVIKIAKPWKVDDLMLEYRNHKKMYEAWMEWILEWKIDKKIRIPQIKIWKRWDYFSMEKIQWQSLHTKTLLEHYKHKIPPEDFTGLSELTDAKVRNYLKTTYALLDYSLDLVIEDHSGELLAELLWFSYTWRVEWIPLREALNYLEGKGMVHRDLHPGNIMLDKNENIYIIDFWRAKII